MFQVKSGKVRISDPCYTKDTWCAHSVKAKNGEWEASVTTQDEGAWGTRVSHLTAHHIHHQYDLKLIEVLKIGVDSGQAGVFDEASYPEGKTGEYGDLNTFYGLACSKTYDKSDHEVNSGYVNEMGFVSSSGFGDGSYKVEIFGNDEGEATKIVITFIEEEDDDYEDDDYAEDDEELDEFLDEYDDGYGSKDDFEAEWADKEGDLED